MKFNRYSFNIIGLTNFSLYHKITENPLSSTFFREMNYLVTALHLQTVPKYVYGTFTKFFLRICENLLISVLCLISTLLLSFMFLFPKDISPLKSVRLWYFFSDL